MTSTLRLPAPDPAEVTVPALLLRNAEDHGDLPALSWREQHGKSGESAGPPSPGPRPASASPGSRAGSPTSASGAAIRS